MAGSKLAKVLRILEDGCWHELEEICQSAGMSQPQLRKTMRFLKDYGFVVLDGERKKAKLDSEARKFLTQKPIS